MISVIVSTLNEEKSIKACLESIRKQNVELILVDGGSKDNTVEIAKKYVDKILYDGGKGLGYARNLGALNASNEIVAFTDADTVVAPDWAEQIEEKFKKDRSLLGVGGVVKPLNGTQFDNIIYRWNSDLWYRTSALLGFYQLAGNNCAYRKILFEKNIGFDESLSFLEDTDYSLRISRLGKVRISKKIIVYSSPRRFKQKGYLGTWIKFFRAYLKYFMNKPLENDYFNGISKS